jgi:hypothetical protein
MVESIASAHFCIFGLPERLQNKVSVIEHGLSLLDLRLFLLSCLYNLIDQHRGRGRYGK